MTVRQKPRFSIVIPAFNEETYIGATLESLQKQNFIDGYEIIVVNNNSTDNTVKIAQQYNIKLIDESRPGVCWARQAGTEAAEGEIVISTDADTIFDTDWLQNIDQQFKEDNSIVAVCGPCQFVNPPWWGKIYPKLLFGAVVSFYKIIKKPIYITATNTAFKKSAWDNYDMKQTQGADELGLLHKLAHHGRVVFTNKYVVYTSSRRLNNGLWYNIFVSFLFYYLTGYYINKIFKRQIIGTAPAYRQNALSKMGSEMMSALNSHKNNDRQKKSTIMIKDPVSSQEITIAQAQETL